MNNNNGAFRWLQLGFMASMFALLVALLARTEAPAAAGEDCKPIHKAPAVIHEPGRYCLTNDIKFNGQNGYAIEIKADRVELDLGGHWVEGSYDPGTEAVGVYMTDQKHVTIHNGTIAGFLYGIRVQGDLDNIVWNGETGASYITIEDIQLLDNFSRGVLIWGSNATIRDNLVENTGGTEAIPHDYVKGIEVIGPGTLIENNRVLETYGVGVGEGVGISLARSNDGCLVQNNFIYNSGEGQSVYVRTFGFWVDSPDTDAVFLNNTVVNYTYAFRFMEPGMNALFKDNRFVNINCGVSDYPTDKDGYIYTDENEFFFDTEGCMDRVETYQELAEQGDALAQFRLGSIYQGTYSPQYDLCKSVYWYGRAVENGMEKAEYFYQVYKERADSSGVCDTFDDAD